jgi:hypothetical protein
MNSGTPPSYLTPYRRAVERFGGTFQALLWASPRTQAMRFEAARRLVDFEGQIIADIGCGRADLLDYLLDRRIEPAGYIGIEAVEALAEAAEHKHHPRCTILRADVVREPARLFVGADVVLFSGSLNTMDALTCHATLRHAFRAATHTLLFNFLDSPALAGEPYLTWHARDDMLAFARTLSDDVELIHDYLPGDCTMRIRRPAEPLDEFDEQVAEVLRTPRGPARSTPGAGSAVFHLPVSPASTERTAPR